MKRAYPEVRRADGLCPRCEKNPREGRKAYCVSCERAYARARYAAKSEVREQVVARNSRWKVRNPARRRELNREAQSRYARTEQGALVNRKAAQTYRARRAELFVEEVDHQIVWERDEGVCGVCGTPADRADWHLDHVIPLACGGEHSYANTQVSHPECNERKGDRVLAPGELLARPLKAVTV